MNIGFILLILAFIPALFKRSALFSLVWAIGSAFLAYDYLSVLFSFGMQDFLLSLPSPIGTASIYLDRLSAFFGLIFSVGLPLGIFFGHGYLKGQEQKGLSSHLFWLGLLGISMHALLWLKHSLLFLIFWELMGIASFFCVIHSGEKSFKVAINYLVTMQIGGLLLMVGFGMMYLKTGSFDFAHFAAMPRLPLYLLMIGFSFKAGFVPLSFWLPQAHPVAPSHISGIMSAMMIKTGIFGIMNLITVNPFSLIEILIFILVSLISAFWGVFHAMISGNLKRALAFSSIENIGVIGLGLSLGLLGLYFEKDYVAALGFAGALMHILFHSFFKAMLFYLSGNVQSATGSLELDELGSLAKKMPKTALFFLIGSFAIATLPLGNGFISEFSIYFGLFSLLKGSCIPCVIISILSMASLAFVGALALIAFGKIFGIVFLGEPRSEKAIDVKESPWQMRLPQLILSTLILFTGIAGGLGLKLVSPVLSFYGLDIGTELPGIYLQISLALCLMLIIFILLYFIRFKLVKEERANTWGCGYHQPNTRMQYSSYAFSHPLSYFLKPFVLQKREISEISELYPKQINFNIDIMDPFWEYLALPAAKAIGWFFSLFTKEQNRRINIYITFGLICLIILLIRALGFK